MEENIQAQTPEQQVIMDALAKVEADKKARESLMQDTPQETEAPEIPEDLNEVGAHSVQEMGVLARIGKSTRSFDYGGNRIVLRTLTVGEELEILSRCDAFPPLAQSKAYVIYTTAVSIESVNGMPYFERLPLGPKDDMYTHKFKHFVNDLYPPTINRFIDEYNILRQEVQDQANYAKKE